MSDKFFYLPISKKYKNIDECFKDHGSAMLVADHEVLDQVYEQILEIKNLKKEIEKLREIIYSLEVGGNV